MEPVAKRIVESRFYEFDFMWGCPDYHRWVVAPQWNWATNDRLMWCEPVENWQGQIAIGKSKRHDTQEDTAWNPTAPIVSERFCTVAKPMFGERAQFLPLRLTDEETGESLVTRAFVLHPVAWLSCTDESVQWRVDPDGKPDQRMNPPVIDRALASPEDTFGRLLHARTKVVIRGDLALQLNQSGLKGIKFRELKHDGDPRLPFRDSKAAVAMKDPSWLSHIRQQTAERMQEELLESESWPVPTDPDNPDPVG
ncbi:MAG: hypothetical protein RIB32_01140 [Phycisphaerales bacterium]